MTARFRIAFRAMAFLWLLFAEATPAGADPPEDIARLVHPLVRGEQVGVPLEDIGARARRLDEDLQRWRRSRPDDLEGIVALAQITWLRDRLEPHVAAGDSVAGSPRNRQARSELQRIAPRHPRAAVLPYWTAQLLASPVVRRIDGHLTARPLDLETAITAARRAHDMQPRDERFLETLASLLTEAFRDDEAWELVSSRPLPLRRLLRDLHSVPLPAGAHLLPEDSRRFAEDQLARGRIDGALAVRARVYLLPLSADAYEEVCRRTWPGFRLLAARRAADAPPWRHHAMQVLLLGGGEPRPVDDLAQLEVSAMDGITLTLIELTDPPEEKRRRSPAGVALPESLASTFTYLYVLNDRTIH